ncbi:proteoglycan 4 [Sphaeramia orbicularis]|uniref:Proteoglycan 4-like n=1 Tax=Sphaeramia orbicularis TaxID=375764 RepID=A0A672Y2W1_9TELE|nr:proteoglycan 4-like [Sphaeramia orbicularis]
MAVAYSTVTQPGLLSQQYPPPLFPKPGKDNVRLQKLIKRTAKKKASAQASQSSAPFRSSLSPVNEASPDLEHSDHATPPRTPETPSSLYVQHPPRFTVRPLYQHVASPYPHRAAYGRPARMSPQTVGTASFSYSQHVSTVSYSATVGVSPAAAAVAQAAVPKISLPASSVPETTVPAVEVRKPAFSTHPAATSPAQTPYPAPGGQAVTRPLTVLTPFAKSKSPRPTFKATEPSRSPKPMFDVPQIRMYTASTSYYETSRTPPVYDTAGLTSIGSTVPHSKTDTKRDLTPTSELRRGTTPPVQPTAMGTDTQRRTPTLEVKRGITPTGETNRVVTPTTEMKRATPTSEVKRATPTSEIRVKTPTYDFQVSRTSCGRPKTPAYHVTRATTPVFEISRPNPLLFVVSQIITDPERSRTPKTVSAGNSVSVSQSVKTNDLKPPETILNGDIHSVMTPVEPPAAIPTQQSIVKSKSEPDLPSTKTPAAPVGSQTPKPPTSEPKPPAVTPHAYQRPKTPTYEASRLMTAGPGYKRPKTPTYGTSPSGVSPVGFQRPKTPTQVAHKSSYRGLTPAEYAAYGGIKTYSPAFGLSGSKPQEEVKTAKEELAENVTPSQDVSVKDEVSKVKETPKEAVTPHVKDEKVSTIPAVPVIVVSQASETSGTTITQEKSTVSSHVVEKPTVTQETPKAKPPKQEEKPSEKEKVETPAQEVTKPMMKSTEVTQPLPKEGSQDPLKAVRKLLGKDKVQTTEQKAGTEGKAKVSEPKQVTKPSAEAKADVSKLTALSAAEPKASDNKGKEEKAELASAAKSTPEKKEEGESALAAEPLLKVIQKPKGVKSKMSGWSRLKKHMVVEQEEPQFPELGSQKEASGQDQSETTKADEKAGEQPAAQVENQAKDAPKATKMWDAVLFQMFSTKENIMHQIELNKSEEEKKEETNEPQEIPSFAYRLPVLLFSPKFDAKRLKEAASRPATKISTVFEMGLIGRKGKDEEPKDFNRTARGFTAT